MNKNIHLNARVDATLQSTGRYFILNQYQLQTETL